MASMLAVRAQPVPDLTMRGTGRQYLSKACASASSGNMLRPDQAMHALGRQQRITASAQVGSLLLQSRQYSWSMSKEIITKDLHSVPVRLHERLATSATVQCGWRPLLATDSMHAPEGCAAELLGALLCYG